MDFTRFFFIDIVHYLLKIEYRMGKSGQLAADFVQHLAVVSHRLSQVLLEIHIYLPPKNECCVVKRIDSGKLAANLVQHFAVVCHSLGQVLHHRHFTHLLKQIDWDRAAALWAGLFSSA